MVHYKLTYFQGKGRAEGTRFLFAYAGVNFDDHRINHDQWAALKPTTPMGQVPVLEVDGKFLCQSMAIARFVGREFGLGGDTAFDQALADMYVDGLQDLLPHMRPVSMAMMQGKPESEIKELYAKAKAEHLMSFIDRYEKYLTANGGQHLVGKKTSWADILLAEFLGRLQDSDQTLLAGHSKLQALVKTIFEHPGVKKYVASRPQTAF